ncbi:hypothetical protein UCRPC4_g05092 [Phaeomoniella chlamydospora]|uniref:Uncharacterized protein n=1 Tax=Phaeomoniella chlamydospora TaxID=158046 RepID=A0A0G2E553_PHACM|nr:hypothetical protein UCRPC4_g05092 [Phaeomoniella chlamydospora]
MTTPDPTTTIEHYVRDIHQKAMAIKKQYSDFHHDTIQYIHMSGRDRQARGIARAFKDLTDATFGLQGVLVGQPSFGSGLMPVGILRFTKPELDVMIEEMSSGGYVDQEQLVQDVADGRATSKGMRDFFARYIVWDFLRIIDVKEGLLKSDLSGLARKMIAETRAGDAMEECGSNKKTTAKATVTNR